MTAHATKAPPLNADEWSTLQRTDTPTIANTIDLLKLRPRRAGYADSRLRCCFPELGVMAGYAVTATFRAADPPPDGRDVYSVVEKLLAAFAGVPRPVVVVIQDLDDTPVAATFGELMVTAFKTFGAVGIVTNGPGRDLEQVRARGVHAFTSGACCAKAFAHLLDVNVAVNICGATIYPGDLVHADMNGLTTIPPDEAHRVVAAIPKVIAAEAQILDYLDGAGPDGATLDGFAAARRRCADEMKKIT